MPGPGETIEADSFEKHLGGKGFNEAYACAKLKEQPAIIVRMVGNVGSDAFGEELTQALKDVSVDTQHVRTISNASTGVAAITVERATGENRIMIVPGANGSFYLKQDQYDVIFPSKNDLENNSVHYVMLQNEVAGADTYLQTISSRRPDIKLAYNPSPFDPKYIDQSVLRYVDLLIVNEGEAMAMANKLDFHQIDLDGELSIRSYCILAKFLVQYLSGRTATAVIITLGSKGVVYIDNTTEEAQYMNAAKVENEVVDTTGAGDTFYGAVVLQLVAGKSLKTAVGFATVASSLAVQKRGAAESMPSHAEVCDRLQELEK